MAGPITWKNVTPVDTSGEVNAYLRAGQQLGQSLTGLGDVTQGFVDDRVQANTDMMTAELLDAGDDMNAANAIIQKYAASNFAPTTASIQKSRQDLMKLGEYNDQLLTNKQAREKTALDMKRTQLGMDKTLQDMNIAAQNAQQSQTRFDNEQSDRTNFVIPGKEIDLETAKLNRAKQRRSIENTDLFRAYNEQVRTGDTVGAQETLSLLQARRAELDPNQTKVLADESQRLAAQALDVDTYIKDAIPESWKVADSASPNGWRFDTPDGGIDPKQIEAARKKAIRKMVQDNKFLTEEAAAKLFDSKSQEHAWSNFSKNVTNEYDLKQARKSKLTEFRKLKQQFNSPAEAQLKVMKELKSNFDSIGSEQESHVLRQLDQFNDRMNKYVFSKEKTSKEDQEGFQLWLAGRLRFQKSDIADVFNDLYFVEDSGPWGYASQVGESDEPEDYQRLFDSYKRNEKGLLTDRELKLQEEAAKAKAQLEAGMREQP